jgi:hypothetical protein
MFDGEALVWPWMSNSRCWKVLVRDLADPFPRHRVFLATPSQRAPEQNDNLVAEVTQCVCVRWHCVMVEIPPHNLPQPFADGGNWQVHHSP